MKYESSYEDHFAHSEPYEDYLMHYGVPGMKWGVRHYQNYSYDNKAPWTKKALNNFFKKEDKYNESKQSYKNAKKEYRNSKKSKNVSKIQKSREALGIAKNTYKEDLTGLKKAYKNIKSENLADKGRNLYGKGYTISGNNDSIRAKQRSLVSLGFGAASIYKSGILRGSNANIAAYTTALASAAGVGALGIKRAFDKQKDKKLRAYYSHTSK